MVNLVPLKQRLSAEFIILLVIMASSATGHSSSEVCTLGNKESCGEVHDNKARYDFYRIYQVQLETEKHVELLKDLEQQSDSLSFMGHAREVGQKLSILVAAHKVAEFDDLLKTYEVKNRILTYNFQEKIDKNLREVLPIGTDLSKFDWKHYFHLETIYAWLEQLAKKYPADLTLLDIGESTLGVSIKGLRLARNPANKAIFIESGIHAREWIAPATATYIINELITSSDPAIQNLANNYNWIIFPSINPDGYKYSFEYDRMWRKNRKLFGISRGVDLNRNYPDAWNSTGCSSDPSRYDYSGPSAASETETQRIINFVEGNVAKEQIKAYISLHSFSQMIMFPYGHTKDRVPNYDDLQLFGKKAATRIKELSGRVYTSGSSIETIYPSSGGSTDWAYTEAGIPISYIFELRGPPDSSDMFILPAVEIEPTAKEAFAAIQTIVEEAAKKGYFN